MESMNNTPNSENQEERKYTPMSNEPPKEICKWNWGAFVFNIWWGIGNKAYISLLCLIPFFNIVWVFFCGALGNKWAWKAGNFENAEDFLKVQESWNRAGFVSFIVTVVLAIFIIIFTSIAGISLMNYSDLI